MCQFIRKFHTIPIAVLALAIWAVASGPAMALMLGFENITGNDAGNAAIGEAQLTLEVSDSGGGVSFEFGNSGPAQSTITHIYFDDGITLDASTLNITSDPGIAFALDGRAGNLPGGNSLDPKFETILSVGADSPSPKNGVNPAESVTLIFGSLNYQSLAEALNAGLLRVGIHVQNYANGGSESFITIAGGDTPDIPQVDEPDSLMIFGAGIIGAIALRRRRKTHADVHSST